MLLRIDATNTETTSRATSRKTHSGNDSRLRYRPELDGLRALAVLGVFATHAGWAPLIGGWIGVGVFFVLSGYLITTLLLQEWDRSGRIALRDFYVRRVRRLYPALLVMLLACAPFAAFFGDGGTAWGYVRTALFSGLYLQDLVSGLSGTTHGQLLHTWSLAVEEQFYLVWPPVLILLLRRGRSVLGWALAGVGASWFLLVTTTQLLSKGPPATYVLPWTRAGELLLGCALAAWLAGRKPGTAVPQALSRFLAPVALVGLGVMFLTVGASGASRWFSGQIMVVAGLTAALIVGLIAAPGGPATHFLTARPLVRLGRVSYGFYLFHLPIMKLVGQYTALPWGVAVTVDLLLTLAITALSYRFVESRFLPRHRPRGADPQPPGVSAASQNGSAASQ